MKLDEIGGGGAILPGEILLFWPRSFPGGAIKPNREGRETLIGKGTEEGRSACSTEDSGPEKPGNRVEEKTPGIGEDWWQRSEGQENPPFMTVNTHPSAPIKPQGNRTSCAVTVDRGRGSRRRKTMRTTEVSRDSVVMQDLEKR